MTDNGDPQLEAETSFPVTVYMTGDTNGDGKVNVLDAAMIGLNWGKTAADPAITCGYVWGSDIGVDGADLNNDCKVDILDAVIVGTMWGHTAW
ncbi:MAG: dockerin type I domain-containing protein [Methanosarcinales archaeon]